jgi:hypothetical protein
VLCFAQPTPSLKRIRALAVASIVVYTVGIPVSFAVVLWKYKQQIYADQLLRSRGTGNSRRQNKNYHIRQRYQKLYSIFRPELAYWRLVLMARKLAIAVVAIMFSAHPMFQARFDTLCCVFS